MLISEDLGGLLLNYEILQVKDAIAVHYIKWIHTVLGTDALFMLFVFVLAAHVLSPLGRSDNESTDYTVALFSTFHTNRRYF